MTHMLQKLGASTYCMIEDELSDVLECIEDAGLGMAEVLSEGLHSLAIPSNMETLLSYSLSYTVHAPIDLNLASVRDPIRRASVEVIADTMEKAAQLDAELVVVHPGHYTWKCEEEEAHKSCAHSLDELSLISEELGVKVGVENLTDWGNSLMRHPSDTWLANSLSLVLDVGHANLMGCLDGFLEEDVLQKVVHVHLHNNDGKGDLHQALGEGNIQLEEVIRKLEGDRSMVIEVGTKDALLKSVEWLKERGFF